MYTYRFQMSLLCVGVYWYLCCLCVPQYLQVGTYCALVCLSEVHLLKENVFNATLPSYQPMTNYPFQKIILFSPFLPPPRFSDLKNLFQTTKFSYSFFRFLTLFGLSLTPRDRMFLFVKNFVKNQKVSTDRPTYHIIMNVNGGIWHFLLTFFPAK